MELEEGAILAKGARDVALQLVGALGGRSNPKLKKGLVAYAMGQTLYDTVHDWMTKQERKKMYTVAVAGDDAIYPDVHRWVLENLPPESRRAMVARSTKQPNSSSRARDNDEEPPRLRLFYDGTRAQDVRFDGHRVTVSVERGDAMRGGSADRSSWIDLVKAERVVFTCYSLAARDTVLSFLQTLTKDIGERAPRFYMGTRWGGWVNRSEVPPRPLETVVLREGQRERLVADLTKFLASEDDYARWGMPYHRGYLFHGAPGTGKTSVASALAGHLGLDVYYISLGAVENDGTLTELLEGVEPHSVLLLEDIDIVHGAKSREGKNVGVTLAGLLNALDGFVTPYGLISIMTTNNRVVLDPALVRPGRVDVDEHIGFLDEYQLRHVLGQFLPDVDFPFSETVLATLEMGITPAEVIGVLKEHMDDQVLGAVALAEFFSNVSYKETQQ